MLDSYTSNMCLSSWGRNTYARALVEFSAEEELKDSIVIAIPLSNGKGHTLAKIEVEYEWNPPRCNTCKVFDHVNDKCPKNPKVDAPTKAVNDGFTVVTKRKLKPNQKNKQVEGVRLSKPALNLQYRRVDKTDSSRINEKVNNEPINLKTNVPIPKKINVLNIPTQNSFGALTDDEEKGDMTTILNEDSDCEEVDAEMVFDDRNGQTFTTKGASTPVISENNLSVFAILESHVVKSKLMKMCSLVFRHWDWTSNGAWCSKGTRIILGWNHNEVLDVQNTGLQFTWNQKPKGTDGILKKLDRVMANMTFVNDFAGSHAIFKPYRNSDHSPSVLCIPTATKVKPKPFKFFNVLIKHDRFKEVVNEAWNYHVSGFYMFRTVKKLKNLKKPLRKLMIDKGNLHANVERIRGELDTIQTQLDIDPFNIRLREIEAANVVAFNQAVLDEEICAFKVGHSNGYDTVDWAFLNSVLMGFGFHERMIAWIMECVSSTSYSICINGNLHGYFQGKRGLRQVIAVPLSFHSGMEDCDKLELINLCFADDLFIFAYGDVQSVVVIKECLDEFKHASGLIPSIPKSTAFFCNVLNHVKLSILNVLPFEEGRLPVKYLGVPLVSSRLKARDCKELVEKVQNRVLDWKNKALSIAGRLQLIRSVISSMHVFWASVFVIPNRVLMDIEQSMRNFLWCPSSSSKGKAKVAWELVCLPKDEGGLGIRRLEHFNSALLVSHIWKLLSLKESLWVKWVHAYKLNGRNFWDVPIRGVHEGHLASRVSLRDIHRAGLTLYSQVGDVIRDDRVSIWDYSNVLGSTCPLCEATPDSHEHLFFICPFANSVWNRMKVKAGLGRVSHNIYDIVDHFGGIARRKTTHVVIAKLVVAASAYFIWQERNWRLFKKSKRSIDQVVSCISSSVRMKLLSCAFKRTTRECVYACVMGFT
ncbi:reverse transcriptase domain, reverse transcriptase zinc-binding domain protein [Tanacetum coccineum]